MMKDKGIGFLAGWKEMNDFFLVYCFGTWTLRVCT